MELRIKMQDKVREKRHSDLDKSYSLFTEALSKTEPRIIRDLVAPRVATLTSARFAREMAGKALKQDEAATCVVMFSVFMMTFSLRRDIQGRTNESVPCQSAAILPNCQYIIVSHPYSVKSELILNHSNLPYCHSFLAPRQASLHH